MNSPEALGRPDPPALFPLTPSFNEAEHGVYFQVLESALTGTNQEAVRNIALSGSHGVGKSSILQQVAHKYEEWVLQISFSTLGVSDTRTEEPQARGADGSRASGAAADGRTEAPPTSAAPLSKTNLIQKEIVKQLLYRENPESAPGSRFHRISRPDPLREALIALLAGLVVATVSYLSGWTWRIAELVQPNSGAGRGTHFVAFLAASALAYAVVALSRHRFRIDRVSAGPATISLGHGSASFFDQYLDEIVYFFESTKYDIVIFEDIDRFNDPHIFETLRALNTLLNGAKQLRGRSIRFIYAIKDSIFDELGARGAREGDAPDLEVPDEAERAAIARANRTKFFDLVIPVVPFVTHLSARDLMSQIMADVRLRVSAKLIDLAAPHVADMRLIKNIRNEYEIFSSKIIPREGDGLKLHPDSLFAMMLYKNMHLADFEAVRLGRSKLDTIYRFARNLVNDNIVRLNMKAQALTRQIETLDSIAARSARLGDELHEYVDRLAQAAGGLEYSLAFDGTAIADGGLRERSFWESFVGGESDLIQLLRLPPRPGGSGSLRIAHDRVGLARILRDPLDESDWREADRAELMDELAEIRHQVEVLSHADMAQLLDLDQYVFELDRGAETFAQYVERTLESRLACDLVRAGYINRDFTLYSSTYYADRVTAQAMNFVMHNVAPNVMDVHFRLEDEDVRGVLREAGTPFLRRRASFNVDILDFLIGHDGPELETILESLRHDGVDQLEFLRWYMASGSAHRVELAMLLAPRWPRILAFIVSEIDVDSALRVELFGVALQKLSEGVSYAVDDAVRAFFVANHRALEVVTSPDVEVAVVERFADVVKAPTVALPSLAALSAAARDAFVLRGMYSVTRANLVAATGQEDLALDVILRRSPHVYSHVLGDLDGYLADFSSDDQWPYTVRSSDEIARIASDVLKLGHSRLDAVIEGASPECVVDELDESELPSEAWPFLAKHGRLAVSLRNVETYIAARGGIDESLAALLMDVGAIEVEDGDAESRAQLAIEILGSRFSLPSPSVRVGLVQSLQLATPLSAESVEPEAGELIGLLIHHGLLPDDAESFALVREADWPSREYAISMSKAFVQYMGPREVPSGDLSSLFRSKRVSPEIKMAVLDRFAEFMGSADQLSLTAAAEYAIETGHRVRHEDLLLLAAAKVKSSLVLDLLAPLLAELSLEDIAPLLRSLGAEYESLASASGRRPSVPNTPGVNALLQRLVELGTISSVRRSARNIRVNMKRA